MKQLSLLLLLLGGALLGAQTPGTLDLSFGTDGKTVLNIDGSDLVYALDRDSSDALYLAGYTLNYNNGVDQDFLLVKLGPDGLPDPSFGTGGVVRSDFPGYPNARLKDIAVFHDRIYALGEANAPTSVDTQAVFIGKWTLDGQLDTTFGQQGYYHEHYRKPTAEAGQLKVLPDGRLLLMGSTLDTFAFHTDLPLWVRLHPNGVPDSTFGGTGRVIWNFTYGINPAKVLHTDGARGMGICVTEDRYLMGGYYYESNYAKGILIAVDTLGQADMGFGTNGVQVVDLRAGNDNGITDILWDGEQYWLGGIATSYFGGEDMAILRMSADGSEIDYEPADFDRYEDRLQDFLLDQDTQVVYVGYSWDRSHSGLGYESDAFAAGVRYSDGSQALGFGDQGQAWLPLGLPNDQSGANAVVQQSDGSLVVAGFRNDSSATNFSDIVVVRLHHGKLVGQAEPNPEPLPSFRVYPNPVSEVLYLPDLGQEEVKFINAWGQVIWQGIPPQGQLSVQDFPAGAYWIWVAGKGSRRVIVQPSH